MLEITERSRNLRNNPTEAEGRFWEEIRNKKLGYKFLRQKPLRFYVGKKLKYFIADFYCRELKLVIELDGKIHLNQKEYDEARSHIINQMGFTVLRFTNEQIFNNIQECINAILLFPRLGEKVPSQ
jgi:very-short-patch-repair endonuclease